MPVCCGAVIALFSAHAVFWIVVGIPAALALIALGAVLSRSSRGDGS